MCGLVRTLNSRHAAAGAVAHTALKLLDYEGKPRGARAAIFTFFDAVGGREMEGPEMEC